MREELRHVLVDMNQMKQFERVGKILTHGDGVWVWDSDGQRYLDAIAGIFVVSVGHRNQRVIRAMTDQMQRITFAAPTQAANDRMLDLARRLVDLTPPELTTVKLHTGGSEAIEAAIKMARQYHQLTGSPHKYKIIARYGNYHGSTLGALSATGIAPFRMRFEPLAPGFLHVANPSVKGCGVSGHCPPCDLGCADMVETLIKGEGPETIAALIIEPVANMAGVQLPPTGYLERVRSLCDAYNIILIYDEIVTGFGRVGSWFAADHFGVWPDISCVGKGITSGYAPLSAAIVHDRIAQAFRGDRSEMVHFNHGITYGGNPLSCAAAIAVIDEITDRGLLDNAKRMGERLRRNFEALRADHSAIGEIRGLGLLTAVDIDLPAPELSRLAEQVRQLPMICLGPIGGTLRFAPPLIIESEQIDVISQLVHDALCAGGF